MITNKSLPDRVSCTLTAMRCIRTNPIYTRSVSGFAPAMGVNPGNVVAENSVLCHPPAALSGTPGTRPRRARFAGAGGLSRAPSRWQSRWE